MVAPRTSAPVTGPTERLSPPPQRQLFRSGWRVLWRGIRHEPWLFTVSVVGSAVFSVVVIGAAFVLGGITARVVRPALTSGEARTGALVLSATVLLGMALLRVFGILGRRLAAGVMQFRLQARYRRLVVRKYLELSPRWHQSHSTGTLLSVVNSDVEASWGIIAPLPFAVGTVIMLVLASAALLATDWVLALVGFMVFPAVVVLNLYYSRFVAPRMRRVQRLRAAVADIAHESFDGALLVKAMGRDEHETARFSAAATRLRDALVTVGRARGVFDPLMDMLPNLGTIAVLGTGGYRLSTGAVTLGELVSVAFLFSVLAFPLRAIGWVLVDLPRTTAGADRVEHVLAAHADMTYGTRRLVDESTSSRAPLALSAHGVGFAYPPPRVDELTGDLPGPVEAAEAPAAVLTDVSLEVPAGSTVALVGPTGAGKSTLVMLAARLLDPGEGSVRIDGVDVRELAEGELAGAVAFVGQSAFLFDDTVRGNLTLGEPFDDAELWRALRAASLEETVTNLPDGLNTRVGERGVSLSGGQRQRLALARALVRKPRLLILDDATSSVDPVIEQRVLRGIKTAAGAGGEGVASTVLLVAYRRASIALADHVVYLERGRVVAQGSHDELLTTAPGYAELITAYDDAEPTDDARGESATLAVRA